MIKIQTILVPVDFSAHSEHALEYAIDLAGKVGAGVHLMHCYGAELMTSVPYDHYVPKIPADYEELVRKAAEHKLGTYVDRAEAAGIETGSNLTMRQPADAILDTAREVGADLIVMGTHGLRGFKHFMVGSVAERTVRTAECPVLTVRLPAEDQP